MPNTISKARARELVGSVSSGTTRDDDLASAFLDFGESLAEETGNTLHVDAMRTLRAEWDDIAGERYAEESRDGGTSAESDETASDCVARMFDAIDAMLPSGFYFGAHVGDGADFGVWPAE